MTPIEEAQHILMLYMDTSMSSREMKYCAKITVTYAVMALKSYGVNNFELQNMDSEIRFYNEVINEINKLK